MSYTDVVDIITLQILKLFVSNIVVQSLKVIINTHVMFKAVAFGIKVLVESRLEVSYIKILTCQIYKSISITLGSSTADLMVLKERKLVLCVLS